MNLKNMKEAVMVYFKMVTQHLPTKNRYYEKNSEGTRSNCAKNEMSILQTIEQEH